MPRVDVYDLQREKVGEVLLDDSVFAAEVRPHLFHEVVRAQLASRRAGTHATKGRAAVRGSTRKIFRPPGTGRARHGSKRAPVFRGGGKVHTPHPRDYSLRPPRKVRKAAMRSALSLFHKEGRLFVVDAFALAEIKTRSVRQVMDRFEVGRGVIVDLAANETLRLSARNLPAVTFMASDGLNLYDILRADRLLITRAGVDAVVAALRPAPRRAALGSASGNSASGAAAGG